jgi:hypothetical protein
MTKQWLMLALVWPLCGGSHAAKNLGRLVVYKRNPTLRLKLGAMSSESHLPHASKISSQWFSALEEAAIGHFGDFVASQMVYLVSVTVGTSLLSYEHWVPFPGRTRTTKGRIRENS